jgi:hypothetical protein
VRYRKSFELNDLDSIILSYLELYDDTLDYKEFAFMLGFAVDANMEKESFYDAAEDAMFSSFLDSLVKFHLIAINCNQDNRTVVTTKWGKGARTTKIKYLYYEGLINLHEHHQLSNSDSNDAFFAFKNYGIPSEIINSKGIDPFENDPKEISDNVLLKKAIVNYKQEESNPNVEILWVDTKTFQVSQVNSKLSLTLFQRGISFDIVTSLNSIQSPELDQAIKDSSNSEIYKSWMALLQYEQYMNSAGIIRANELLLENPV